MKVFIRYVSQEPFLFTGLERLAGKKIANQSVSGGERQRIALARALYCGRDWIFMDEPTNNLDADTVTWIKEFIRKTDRALVFVTHDRELMEEAQEVIAL